MARNLASSQGIGNHPLLVWNRSPAKAEALLEELGSTKIRVAASLAEVATESDIIITNLANDAVVTSVYEEMISHLVVPTFTLIVAVTVSEGDRRITHLQSPSCSSRQAPWVQFTLLIDK